jgi:hypothetical protein
MWCIHLIAECTLVSTANTLLTTSDDTKVTDLDKLIINRAYCVIICGLDQDDDEEDD